MKRSLKSVIALVSLMLVYILLASLDVYTTMGLIVFPVLSIPLAICLIKDKLTSGVDFIFNIAIIMGIYLMTYSVQSVVVYLISVCVPAYAAAFFYKKKVPLPNIIMYVSVSMTLAVFIYFAGMKAVGIDYEKGFILLIDQVKTVYFQLLISMEQSVSTQEILQQSMMKEVITLITDTIKQVYPALILIMAMAFTTIQIIFLNSTKMSSLKPLFNFKLSKIAVLVLFIAMMVALLSEDTNSIWVVVALNVLFVLQNLMQVMGIISISVLLKRATIHKGLKVLGYIVLFMLLVTPTSVLMMLGCFDTIFNYRKA
ncbi:MAG: hypothetical protein K0S30_2477, partial [Clostridia bacterium]|nr:hypothetical protein [Clostridia bacterium]